MSIATKTGDKGDTSLLSGERVSKDDPMVEAYGTVDELNSFLGNAKHQFEENISITVIESIQRDLFRIAAELADNKGIFKETVGPVDVRRIEKILSENEKKIKLSGFVIPGNSRESAALDMCRSICRRAERRIISLNRTKKVNNNLIEYMNRLSDLLFMMARSVESPLEY